MFINFAANKLKLKSLPKINLVGSSEDKKNAFGHSKGMTITVRITERHPIDVMRTLAHELIHYRQNITGARGEQMREDQANALAGRIMRDFDTTYPEVFKDKAIKANMVEDVASAVATNAVSGGGIEGIGYGPKGEPGGMSQVMGMVKRKRLTDIIGTKAMRKQLKREK